MVIEHFGVLPFGSFYSWNYVLRSVKSRVSIRNIELQNPVHCDY